MRFPWSVLSIPLLIWSAMTTNVANAAEDDVVVETLTPLPAPTPRAPRLVRMVITPEARAAQRLAQLDHQLMMFLEKVDAECSLSEVQMQKAKLAGKRDMQRFVHVPRHFLADPPSTLFGTDFVTKDSMVVKVLMRNLTSEQTRRFEALRDKEMKAKVWKSLK